MQLISLVPTDPGVLQRVGEIYDGEDRSQAFQYYYEVSATDAVVQTTKPALPPPTVLSILSHQHRRGVMAWCLLHGVTVLRQSSPIL